MKKRIRLTEGQLRNLITKAVLTETNWKTYMNAATKACDRCAELGYYDKNEKAWVPYNEEDRKELYKNLNRAEEFYNASRKAYEKEYGLTDKDKYRTYPISYEKTLIDPWYQTKGPSDEELGSLPGQFNDMHHYVEGDWEWVKGKGWQLKQKNESLARRVTEGVIRKLRRLN